MKPYKLTDKQEKAQVVCAGSATNVMLFGGSRSGKTFLFVRNVVMRALKAPNSRHAIFRFRLNHLKASIFLDTFPKVMRLVFPGVEWTPHTQEMYVELANGSQIWFAGLDDKERTEKILGMEFSTLYFNESSQIPWSSITTAITRMAQFAEQQIEGRTPSPLRLRAYFDCNPPPKSHWTYRLFIEKRDPETRQPVRDPSDYASFQINPKDNEENLSPEYIRQLENLPARMRARFLEGRFAEANPNALFPEEHIDKWRVLDGVVPDMVRIVVAVDPSGADDVDNADNDEIGIVVAGLGTDGNAYLIEDCTVKAGPGTWGKIAASAFDRHQADCIVAETNYGGAMVQQTILVARPRTPFKAVSASRGKVVRAEPFSALYESGKIRHVGIFPELEDELSGFSTAGYTGGKSPNRADALIWALAELFPAIVKPRTDPAASGYVAPQVNFFSKKR
jgi:phage terminase large subunit-like protein